MRARRAAGLRGRVNILVTSSSALRTLNREFRKKDKPTDVLSFPSQPNGHPGKGPHDLVGEIAISADIALQNALSLGLSPAAELKTLMLHGILHLAGFDHERDNGEMARKEEKLRRLLRLPTGLIERTSAVGDSARPSTPRKPKKPKGSA